MTNRNIISSFSYPTKDLKLALQRMNKLVGKGKQRFYQKCDLYTVTDRAVIRIPGDEAYFSCEPIGFGKTSLFFTELFDAVKDFKEDISIFEITNKDTRLNGQILTSEGFKINPENNEVLHQLDLGALNDEVFDNGALLKHSDVVFLQNNGWQVAHINNLRKDVEKASLFLKKYDLSTDELMEFVKGKLKIK